MPQSQSYNNGLPQHGSAHLPEVDVDTYNAELRDPEGFLGDRASNRAFRSILEDWRERLRKVGDDPLGKTPTDEISKKKIDNILVTGEPEAAGLVHGVIEEFAQELATVIRRLIRLKTWRGTQRIVVGGGFSDCRAGKLSIGRAGIILKSEGHQFELTPIRDQPDEAGLMGAAHLAPSWVFEGYDGIIAIDIGGSNIRVGIVDLKLKKHPDLSSIEIRDLDLWRHTDETVSRDKVIERLAAMIHKMTRRTQKRKFRLAPFVGIGCPGLIGEDGSIQRGGQNLPGNWESKRFNLPAELAALMPPMGDHQLLFVMHNDAVLQGLSQLPFMRDIDGWGVLTIGTGLGNAHFTNRHTVRE